MKYYSSYDDEDHENEITRDEAVERISKNYDNAEVELVRLENNPNLLRMRGGFVRVDK